MNGTELVSQKNLTNISHTWNTTCKQKIFLTRNPKKFLKKTSHAHNKPKKFLMKSSHTRSTTCNPKTFLTHKLKTNLNFAAPKMSRTVAH